MTPLAAARVNRPELFEPGSDRDLARRHYGDHPSEAEAIAALRHDRMMLGAYRARYAIRARRTAGIMRELAAVAPRAAARPRERRPRATRRRTVTARGSTSDPSEPAPAHAGHNEVKPELGDSSFTGDMGPDRAEGMRSGP